MSHSRPNSRARQDVLDGLYRSIVDLDAVVRDAEALNGRMEAGESISKAELGERFPALAGKQAEGIPGGAR